MTWRGKITEAGATSQEQDATEVVRRPLIVCMQDVEREEVRWLWHPRIPRRALTLLEGDPGLGKSFTTVRLAAAVSTGGLMPDAPACDLGPRNVLCMTAEDGLGDTVRPRLEDAGADLGRVFVVTGMAAADPQNENREREFAITLQNVDLIQQAVEAHEPALVVIDPVQAFLGAGVDMHRANEVRPILSALARLMRDADAACVLVRHLAKASGGNKGIYRGLGSIDFSGAARSVLHVANHPEDERDEGRRVLVHVKSNLAAKAPTLGFTLDRDGFRWTGPTEVGESEVREAEARMARGGSARPARAGRPPGQREAAEALLEETWAAGPGRVNDCLDAGEDRGLSESTVRRAASRLRVETEGGYRGCPATWALPEGLQKGCQLPKDKGFDNHLSTPENGDLEEGCQKGLSLGESDDHSARAETRAPAAAASLPRPPTACAECGETSPWRGHHVQGCKACGRRLGRGEARA